MRSARIWREGRVSSRLDKSLARLSRMPEKSFYTRMVTMPPGFTRLFVLPPAYGDDPLEEWKKWGDRMSRFVGHRLPGNWKTSRGIRKRQKALMRHFR